MNCTEVAPMEECTEESRRSVNIMKAPGSTDLCDHIDWEYAMRRDMQEIVPGVYLGPYASAMKSKLNDLVTHGITHIICIRQSIEASFVRPNFPQHFNYLVLDIADCPTENIIKHFKQTKDFIDQCLQAGGKILVHGNGGISRSAAVVIAYIMVKFSLTCSEAMSWVRNRRFCISLNEGFQHQLHEYEHIYKAQLLNTSEDTSLSIGVPNRKRKEMDADSASPPSSSSSFSLISS
ncbi:hypothetical protein RRG08_043650 [Elysia crispata]|uniref:Serine/threonine/tyrosine-interacting protein n=1 Tax=Elysia crispata TaxID=231223 RepID=A0AAE1DN43_9GAST|nr:hypothetical protein RRG08_043650 [Elysia crispata]